MATAATWFSLVLRRAPKALRSDRVFGCGNFAVTSCPLPDGIRRVNFFDCEEARLQYEQCHPVCDAETCTGDHREFHLLDRLCAYCNKAFVPVGNEIFCKRECQRRDDREFPR